MKTVLPYAESELSACALDVGRLGKQRVECIQVCPHAPDDLEYVWASRRSA